MPTPKTGGKGFPPYAGALMFGGISRVRIVAGALMFGGISRVRIVAGALMFGGIGV